MDNLDCSGPIVDQTLVELDYINYWLGGDWISLEGLKKKINRSKSLFLLLIWVAEAVLYYQKWSKSTKIN